MTIDADKVQWDKPQINADNVQWDKPESSGNPLSNWLSAAPEGSSPDKRTLGTGEALERAATGRGAALIKTLNDYNPLSATAALARKVTGEPDVVGNALAQFSKEQEINPQTEQYANNAQRTAASLAGLAPDIAAAVATRGGSLAEGVAPKLLAKAPEWLQRGVEGVTSMAVPALTTGQETYDRAREQGEGVLEAGTKALRAGGETLLGGAGPAGPTGGVVKRVIGGAGTNALVAEGMRRLHNAISPESEQEAYDPAQTISAAVLGGTLHGAFGPKAKGDAVAEPNPAGPEATPAYTPTELTAMADQRIAELGAKKNLTPAEQEEHQFLQANHTDHDELADRLGADVKPEPNAEQAAPSNKRPPNEPPPPPGAAPFVSSVDENGNVTTRPLTKEDIKAPEKQLWGGTLSDDNKPADLVAARNDRQSQIDVLNTKRKTQQLSPEENDQLHDLNEQQALTNPMTGLPNKEAFQQAQASGDYSHTYSLDARGFKSINDRFGHNAGDDVLRGIGQHLAESLGNDKDISIFHVSGDEFPLLSKGDQSAKVKQALDDLTSKKFTFQVTEKDGTIHDVEIPGIKVDFGVGKNLDEADANVVAAKEQAAAAGEYTRRTGDQIQRTDESGGRGEEPAGRAADVGQNGREGTTEQPTGTAERTEQPSASTESATAGTERAAESERGTGTESTERDDTGGNQPGGAARIGPERISRVTPSGKDIGFRTQKEAALGIAKRGFDPADYRITKDDNGGYVATRRDNEQNRRAFAESPGAQPVPESGGVRGSARVLAESGGTTPAFSRRESDGSLKGLPRRVGGFVASAFPKAQRVARDYAAKAGIEYNPPATYAKVNPERATRIARAYEEMKHDPHNPDVQRAYKAMTDETNAQYEHILKSGLKVDFIKPGQEDPYAGNPRKMTEDVRNNNHMWVFSTRDGFGSDASFDPSENPLLQSTKFTDASGQPMLANDVFRVVHDYFGHVKEGVGFRADGEENAWRAHSAMYSPEARKAMTSETRGQNSYVNYGPHGEVNRTASAADTRYADQKTGLLPDWVINEGAGDETPSFKRKSADEAKEILGKHAKYLTSAEFEKQRASEAKKLKELLEKLPTAKEMANVALAGKAKRGWYKESADTLTNVFGPDADRFAALLAATSPQTSVESNLRNALHTWKNWVAAGRPTDRDEIVKIMGQSVEGGRGVDSVLNAWINNSVRALTAENPAKVVLSGPKVHSFMQNLRGNVEEVTNDAWMSAYHMVEATILKGALNKEGTEPGKRAGYLALSVRTRQAADALTKLTGEKWTPAEVQETVWSWAKTAYELADSAGELRNVRELVRDGAITDDLIKATPAFGDLFNADEYKRILGEAGLGESLARHNETRGQEVAGAGREAATPAPDTRDLLRAAGRLDKLRQQRAEETRVGDAIPFQRKENGEGAGGITQGAPAHADADSERLSQALAKFTGKPTKFLSVAKSALSDALAGAIRAFEKATGTKINIVRNLTPEHEDFNGVTLKDGVLHVNENNENPITVAAVHEFGHDMRETHPELWNELAQEVERQGLLPQWAKEMRARGYNEKDSPVEELTNDAIADAFHDPQFLDRLAQANPSVFSRVAQAFKAFLDTLAGKFKDAGSNRFLSDVEAFRDKLVDVMRRYGVPEAEAESRAAMQRKPVSVANEPVNETRMDRNVDELASEHGQANADAWANAKAKAESDPTYGRRLTQAILANPRPLSKDEVASLLHDRVRISNEYEAALKDAETKKDPQSLLRLADTERQLNENDNAARLAGTENALGLQGRQMMARQDYSLANMVRRAKIAEGKDTLPQTVMDKLKEISQRIKNADQAIADKNLPRKKTVDEKMQERMKAKIDKLQKTIADRLKACPL